MAGFVVLSTFVPTINACNMVLALVHLTLFLFLTSELLIHLDFYSAIVRPFWHEESIASNENAVTFVVGLAGILEFLKSLVYAAACLLRTLSLSQSHQGHQGH